MANVNPTPSSNAPGAYPWLRWAQIVNQGTDASFTPFLGDDDELRNYLADFNGGDKEIHAFDLIQKARQARFNTPTLQVLLNSLVETLPQAIQDRVGLTLGTDYADPDTGPVIGQSSWFSEDDASFKVTLELFTEGTVPHLDTNNKEFVLWVVDAGTPEDSYYVTIVLWYRPSDPSKPNVLDRIANWAVIDARHAEGQSDATERTGDRMLQLLQDRFEGATRHDVWLPPYQGGEEDYASGLIAYSVVAQLLDRIGTMHCTEFDTGTFFAPLRPWFNPDATRAEALGHAAVKTIGRLNWKARLAVFPTQSPGDDESLTTDAHDLALAGAPPVAYTIPPRAKEDKATSANGSLFGDYVGRDSATQTAEEPDSPIDTSAQAQAPGNSNAEDNKPEIKESDLVEIYYERKQEDLNQAKIKADATHELCLEVQKFAGRVEHEVLEAPTNNIPTGYALERLLWLVRHTAEQARGTERLYDSLDRMYTIESVHSVVADRLQLSKVRSEFDDRLAEFKTMYGYADQVLSRAHDARLRRKNMYQLGEAAAASDVEDGDDDGNRDGVNAGSSRDNPYPNSKVPRKRKYTKEPTSSLDEDGQEVYTLEISTETRPLTKGSQTRKRAKRARQ